jgi:PQQ-like domain
VVFSPQSRWPERPQEKGAEVDLGTRTLLVSSRNATRMKGFLPGRGGPLWETALPPDPSDGARSMVPMLFAAGAVIWLGGPIVAIDELTGQILWRHRDADRYDASVSGDLVWLSNRQQVIALHARTGQELERYSLPAPPHRSAAYRLVVSPQRLALVEANERMTENEDGFLLTWTRKSPAPRLLSRPSGTDAFALLGDVLLAASTNDGELVAVDVARESPPLTRLPPAQAAREALAGTIERVRDRKLQALPDLGAHLVERLRQGDDSGASSALRYLAVHPIPERSPYCCPAWRAPATTSSGT